MQHKASDKVIPFKFLYTLKHLHNYQPTYPTSFFSRIYCIVIYLLTPFKTKRNETGLRSVQLNRHQGNSSVPRDPTRIIIRLRAGVFKTDGRVHF